jgi:hypothetical protein
VYLNYDQVLIIISLKPLVGLKNRPTTQKIKIFCLWQQWGILVNELTLEPAFCGDDILLNLFGRRL